MILLAMQTWQWVLVGVLGLVLAVLIAARVSQGKKKQG